MLLVTKEQGEALRKVISAMDHNELIVYHTVKQYKSEGWSNEHYQALNELTTLEVARAIIEGYKVYYEEDTN